jgi:integrase
MKINFYIRPSRSELKPIYMYVSMFGSRDKIHTNFYCLEKQWDAKKQRIKGQFELSTIVNKELNEMEDKAWKIFEEKMPKDLNEFKEMFSDLKPETKEFFELWDGFLKESKSRINKKKSEKITEDTIRHYGAAKKTLEDFEKKTKYKISFDKINQDFYSRFRSFCLDDEGLNPNTFGSKIRKLKTFLYWCQERDVQVSNKFWSFEIPNRYGDGEPLTGEELLNLWKLKLGNDQWKLDVFLALCSTGMRISDYLNVMTDMDKHIKDTKEGKAIIFKAQKTGEPCIIPFFDDLYFRPVYLYKKYKGKMPLTSSQKLNDFLKDACLIDRIKVTSKTGRKTLASIKYFELGMEAQFVMRQTGHKSESEFKKYLGVSPDTIIKANKEKAMYLKVN